MIGIYLFCIECQDFFVNAELKKECVSLQSELFSFFLQNMQLKEYIAQNLNQEQTAAALHTDTSSLIIAGA